jgi:hypothetical protein
MASLKPYGKQMALGNDIDMISALSDVISAMAF